MKNYVAIGTKHRLAREEHTAPNYGKSFYYRLYTKYLDEFGNEFWEQTWSGSASSGEVTGILAESLYLSKVSK